MTVLPLDSTLVRTLASLVVGRLPPDQVEDDQWEQLIDLSLADGVGCMLLRTLSKASWIKKDDSRWKPLVDVTRNNSLRNILLEKVRWEVARAFDQTEIPAIWLKGIGLAHTCYEDPCLRPMSDLDVLVPGERRLDAREALLLLGFKPSEDDFFELGKLTGKARHHEGFMDRSGRLKLELHFRLLVPGVHSQPDDEYHEWFWTQTEELSPFQPPFRILRPEANLLYLCAHTILQNQGAPFDLLHLLDLHLLITSCTLDWDLVVEQAVELRWTYALEWALRLLPGLFGTCLPEGVLGALQKLRPRNERQPLTWDPQNRTRRWNDWRSVFSRMTFPQRSRLLWLTLFPPAAFVRHQYNLNKTQPLFFHYIHHFLDGMQEAVRAILPLPWQLAFLYLFAITLAEVFTTQIEARVGLVLYGLVLLSLLLHASLVPDNQNRSFLLSLAPVPLIRLLSLALPLQSFPLIYWYMIVGGPLFLAAFFAARAAGLNSAMLGFTFKKLPFQLLISLTGIGLGYIEHLILRPKPLAAGLRLELVWLPALILLIFTGLLEELIFRGLLQSSALRSLGQTGLLYQALIFAVLHMGYHSWEDVVFVFMVALFFGWAVQRSGSILGVTLAHGLTNIGLFLVFPFLFP